ncbi:MAG: AI-2E family transporter [Eubacteriales bacterium]
MEKNLWTRVALRLALFLALGFLGFYAFPLVYACTSPFFFALFAAASLQPVLFALEKKILWKRQVLVLWLLFLLTLGLGGLLVILVPSLLHELWELGENWEILLAQGLAWLQNIQERLSSTGESAVILQQGLEVGSSGLQNWVTTQVSAALFSLSQWIFALPLAVLRFFVFFLATYFLACDYVPYESWLKSHSSPQFQQWATALKDSALHAFGGYLKAQLFLSLGVWMIMLGGFLLIGLPFALLLALGIALLDFIPMIGSGMVLVPWAALVFFMGNSEMATQLFCIWLATALFRYLLEPKILGQQTGLSPLLSLASIYIGLQVGGIWGMIFAPILLLMLLNFIALGLFSGTMADLKLCRKQIHHIFFPSEEII